MTTAREVAVRTLAACEKQGAWSDGHLKKAIRQAELDRRDAALARCDTTKNRPLLTFLIIRREK